MKIQRLHPDKWPELLTALAEARCDAQLPKPEQSIMLGAFDEDRRIGVIGAERVWMVSPLQIDKQYRGNGLAMELVRHLEQYNTEGLTEYCSTSNEHVEKLIYSIGFIPTLGQAYRRERG